MIHLNKYLFCTFVSVLDLVRGLEVKCTTNRLDNTSCLITEPVTIETGEKVNIVSDVNLTSINAITFVEEGVRRSQISVVPKEIFEQLPNLKTLVLHATINVLNKGDFDKADKLTYLNIDNQLKTIQAGVFASAKNLVSLKLSENQIAEIEDNAFSGLSELLYIYLDRNNLTILKQNKFNGLEKLSILDLGYNQIESIEENTLNLPNLRELYMNNNKLTHLSDNFFAAMPSIKRFVAHKNQIKHIGKSLYGLNLEILSLSHNTELTDVDLVAFSQMSVLKNLVLDEIGLTSENISKVEIKEPSKSVLKILSLDQNELTNNEDWQKFALLFPQSEIIFVRYNKYSKIDLGDKTLRQQFPKLRRVHISGEWNCGWLKNFIESSKKDGIQIEVHEPKCEGV